MSILLFPIGGLMLIILVYILKSIQPKENNRRILVKVLISLVFVVAYSLIIFCMPRD